MDLASYERLVQKSYFLPVPTFPLSTFFSRYSDVVRYFIYLFFLTGKKLNLTLDISNAMS